jgi:hypothetical protein
LALAASVSVLAAASTATGAAMALPWLFDSLRLDPAFESDFATPIGSKATHEMRRGGVCAIETSEDPYVVKLLQTHAEVVSAFIANGR